MLERSKKGATEAILALRHLFSQGRKFLCAEYLISELNLSPIIRLATALGLCSRPTEVDRRISIVFIPTGLDSGA
jgi:hypothetical protein